MKKCPYCAEEIQDEAIICRYCGSKLNDAISKKIELSGERTNRFLSKILLIFIPLILLLLQYLRIWPSEMAYTFIFWESDFLYNAFIFVSQVYGLILMPIILFGIFTLIWPKYHNIYTELVWYFLILGIVGYALLGISAIISMDYWSSLPFWKNGLAYFIVLFLGCSLGIATMRIYKRI